MKTRDAIKLLVLLLSFSVNISPAQELVFHYPFNGNLNDSSANRFELVPFDDNVSYTSGQYGSALQLNGSAKYLDVEIPQISNPALNDITFCAWIYSEYVDGTDDTEQIIVAQKDGNGTGRLQLYLTQNDRSSPGTWLGGGARVGTENAVQVGAWQHLAIVTNAVYDSIKFYVNGTLDSAMVSPTPFESCIGGFRIGGHKNGTQGYFNGLIDEVYFFRSALTRDQIIQVRDNLWEDRASEVTMNTNLMSAMQYVNDFIAHAEFGTYPGQYPTNWLQVIEDSLSVAQTVLDDHSNTQSRVDEMTKHLQRVIIDARWDRVPIQYNPKGNLVDVVGDVKQVFIRNRPETEEEMDFLLLSFRDLGCTGLRIPVFGRGPDGVDLNPKPELMKYLYELAIENGFDVFANPAEWGGARRIANQISGQTSDGPGEGVRDDPVKTHRLIDRLIEFSTEYDQLTWLSVFNEDGNGVGSGVWSYDQINQIYEEVSAGIPSNIIMVGPDTWGLPQGRAVMNNTDASNYVNIYTTHNLGKQPAQWPQTIDLATSFGLPIWDSEANLGGDEGEMNRLESAVHFGVDGVVLYNLWTDATDNFPYFNHRSSTRNWLQYYLHPSVVIEGNDLMTIGDQQSLWSAIYPTILEEHIVWSSENEALATVDQTGTVTALETGSVSIRATIEGNSEAFAEFELLVEVDDEADDIAVTSIDIQGSSEMIIGSQQTLSVTVTPNDASNDDIIWSSSDESVATVTNQGAVDAIELGNVTITASAVDGSLVSGSIDIEIMPILISEITISGSDAMMVGESQKLTTTISPNNATDLTYVWNSSDEAIATVSSEGVVTAIDGGEATVTALANDESNTVGSLLITVSKPLSIEGPKLSIYPNPTVADVYLELRSPAELELSNISGKLILEKNVQAGKQGITMKHLSEGVYLLNVQFEDNSQKTIKIIKQ